jgi:hypothetical protein
MYPPIQHDTTGDMAMKKMFVISAFLLGLAVGCVTATVSQNLVIPPVRAGTNPVRWEYICNEINSPSLASINSALNEAGLEGWEFFDQLGNHNLLCYKRPLGGGVAAPAEPAPAQSQDAKSPM